MKELRYARPSCSALTAHFRKTDDTIEVWGSSWTHSCTFGGSCRTGSSSSNTSWIPAASAHFTSRLSPPSPARRAREVHDIKPADMLSKRSAAGDAIGRVNSGGTSGNRRGFPGGEAGRPLPTEERRR